MLWAITAYFNPAGYRTRLANYRVFRARLGVPLVTVEGAVDGRFELGPGDADVLVQRRARDVLWQKERLLNVALRFLPAECKEVAWLDCDAVFGSPDWAERASVALESLSLVHLFSVRRDSDGIDKRSIAGELAAGTAAAADLTEPEAARVRGTTVGLAWAARRSTLEAHGLYDACILGGGDRAIVAAAIGQTDLWSDALAMTPAQAEHYRRWASAFFGATRGRVGAIDGDVRHLWHGDLRHRRYRERLDALARFAFDPFTDIAVDGNDCWSWSTDKPGLHEYVRGYFESRQEDGPAAAAAIPAAS